MLKKAKLDCLANFDIKTRNAFIQLLQNKEKKRKKQKYTRDLRLEENPK